MSGTEAWQPSATRAALAERARMLADIREFFARRGVLEVETPVLSRAGNSDPNLRQFACDGERAWLRTSPEYAMKRLLAAGAGDIYELGRVFRDGERGPRHNPEFTLLEWYRVGWDHHRLMDEVVELVRHCGRGRLDDRPVEKLTYRALFETHAGVDPATAPMAALARAVGEGAPPAGALERCGWLDLLFDDIVSRRVPARSMLVVHDFPAEQAALARVRDGDPPVAERFEVILDRRELANGYHELTDAGEQRQRFEAENRARAARGEPVAPLDEHLLAALAHGLPACAGVALGVDRLLMSVTGEETIADVLAFPAERA